MGKTLNREFKPHCLPVYKKVNQPRTKSWPGFVHVLNAHLHMTHYKFLIFFFKLVLNCVKIILFWEVGPKFS